MYTAFLRFAVVFCVTTFCTRALAAESDGWFNEMYKATTSVTATDWGKTRGKAWESLRAKYKDAASLLQMSWEERDKIWTNGILANPYKTLAGRYRSAYLVSCNERGVQPQAFDTVITNLVQLKKLRDIYLASRKAEYIILTPKASKVPAINGAAVYGVRPGNELIYRIPVSGEKPVKITVANLPAGLHLDASQGVLSGSINREGDYVLQVAAANKFGKTNKKITIKVGQNIALTPPMGWNSWNSFACDVTAQDIKNSADQLVKTGLANYGWSFVNIDDCWMKMPDFHNMPEGREKDIRRAFFTRKEAIRKKNKKERFDEAEMIGNTRDAGGAILSNQDFADMKSLTDYIHRFGLKTGIYTSPGPLTCQCYEGSYEHELADARQFAKWGFDYIKYDWCGYSGISDGVKLEDAQKPYQLMGKALTEVKRDIVYSLCQYGRQDVWKWGQGMGGNLWRTTGDIRDTWESMSGIGFKQAGLESYAGPGHWNDPDMLVVGYVGWSKNLRPTYLSPNEQYTHISLWSLLASPMLIGCDLTRLDDFTYGLLSNAEVIAINQDVLGKQAAKIIDDNGIQVWTKPLADGSTAIGIFNISDTPRNYALNLSQLNMAGKKVMRDVWKQENTTIAGNSINITVNRHGVKLIKI